MSWLARLVERQIEKTRLAGGLTGLQGEGAPLPERPENAFVDAGVAAGFRVMAEAGALPEEIVLGRLIDARRTALSALTDPAARKAAMAELADLELRRAIAQESRRRFLSD